MSTALAAHEGIAKVVSNLQAQSVAVDSQSVHFTSTLLQGHSKHSLPNTVSFTSLWSLHETARQAFASCYVGTSRRSFVFSARLDAVPNGRGKKRARDEGAADGDGWVGVAKKRLRGAAAVVGFVGREEGTSQEDTAPIEYHVRRLEGKVGDEDIQTVRTVLTRLIHELRGSNGEAVVQNVVTELKKLQATDPAPRVVLTARLHGGVAIPVSRLKRCLGPANKDGVLTTNEHVFGAGDDGSGVGAKEHEQMSSGVGSVPVFLVTSIVSEQKK